MPSPVGESQVLDTLLFEASRLLEGEEGSLSKVAARVGIDKSTVARIIKREYVPSAQMLERVLDALGYEVDVKVVKRG